jgi:general secretion pathway protein F
MSEAPASVFNAVVLDRQGHVVTRAVEAASLAQARQLAGAPGFTVLECEPAASASSRRFGWLSRLAGTRRADIDTLAFSQDLATLIQAGVTVRDALLALARKEASPRKQAVLSELANAMSHGLSLSAALQQSGAFPDLLVATIAASEQTGDLAVGLMRYARHQQGLRIVRDKVVGASVYPMLLLAVGSLVVILLLGIVVPRFSRLLDSQGRELPPMSKLLLAWGQFADAHPALPVMMLAAFFTAALVIVSRMRDLQARKRWIQSIPGVAKVAREFQHLQLYRTTAILTSGGIPVHRALDLGADLLGPADRDRLALALSQIREGKSISAALSGAGLADAMATSMLAVAEKSGALSEMLDRIADSYDRSLQRNIDIVTRLIEPALMIVFGILIGGIVVLMYLPIFDLAASIS